MAIDKTRSGRLLPPRRSHRRAGGHPLLARALGIDPAVVSAHFISTIVDMTRLLVYFLIARLVRLWTHPAPSGCMDITNPDELGEPCC